MSTAREPGTALGLAKRVARELGVTEPQSLVTNPSQSATRLRACIDATGRHMRKAHEWPELIREFVVTLPQDTTFFQPPDMLKWISCTAWDRTNDERIRRVTAQEWQTRLGNGWDSSTSPQTRARGFVRHRQRELGAIWGEGLTINPWTYPDQVLKAMLLNGVDSSTAQFAFEYVSKSWLHPPIVIAGDYQKGDIVAGAQYHTVTTELFEAATSFSTGDTADALTIENLQGLGAYNPTGNWAVWGVPYPDSDTAGCVYFPYAYDYIRSDDDAVLLDEDVLAAGAKYRFREMHGQPYAEHKGEYYRELEKATTRVSGAPVVDLSGNAGRRSQLPGPFVDEGGWDL